MTVMPDKTARAVRAREALIARHAELQEVLDYWAAVLATAADRGDPVRPVRNLLRAVLADEVLPHARAEERTLYRAAGRDPCASLLVQALISEHRALAARAVRLGEPAQPAAAAAEAEAISALFASHVAKEDSLLLPALEHSGADLAALLARESRLGCSQLASRCAAAAGRQPASPRRPPDRGCLASPGSPPGTPSSHEPVRNGPAGCEALEHPVRWPSLTTAPHSWHTRQAQQAGSPPSPACSGPVSGRVCLAARR
jgi:hypothetical protein